MRTLGFRFTSNGGLVARDVEQLAARIQDPAELLEDFSEHMLNSSFPANFDAGGRPDRWPKSAWSGENTQKESGRLLRSIQARIGSRKAEWGTNLAYARQRHFGGTIKPKARKALAVPLPGVSRAMRRPRRWGDRLHFIPVKQADGVRIGVLATQERQNSRKGGPRYKWVARFVLKKSVTQPARPFLLFQGEDLAYVSRRMVELVTTGALR